jgi:histone deacetylase 6
MAKEPMLWDVQLTQPKHSLIFVANSHHLWTVERRRKIRKKYGQVRRSDCDGLNQMMDEHRAEVQGLLQQMRNEYDEKRRRSQLADEEQQGLRSPPLPVSTSSHRLNNGNGRPGRASTPTSPKLPVLGFFNVSPRPQSPIKRSFQ